MEKNVVRSEKKWKVLLTVIHWYFIITLAGISAMYLNGGYGKGTLIYDETYEDSDASLPAGVDISNTSLPGIGYKDMFETNGVLDTRDRACITDGNLQTVLAEVAGQLRLMAFLLILPFSMAKDKADIKVELFPLKLPVWNNPFAKIVQAGKTPCYSLATKH